jgi:hypothetical protein
MRTIHCVYCDPRGRDYRVIIVPYINRRSALRRSYYACSYCDFVDAWPNYTRAAQKAEATE